MSPGIWNGNPYDAVEIISSFKNTDWSDPEATSLVLDHIDDDVNNWIGRVQNVRLLGEKIIGDLVIADEAAARKCAFAKATGTPIGISPKLKGFIQNDKSVKGVEYLNFAVVFNPAQGEISYLKDAINCIPKVTLILKEQPAEKKLNADMNSCMLIATQAGYPQDVAQAMCQTAMGMMQPQNGGNEMDGKLSEEFSSFKEETTKVLSKLSETVEKLAQMGQKNDAAFIGRQTGPSPAEPADPKKLGKEDIRKLMKESPVKDKHTMFLSYMKNRRNNPNKGDE